MLTDNWNYVSNEAGVVQQKTPSWSGVPWNMAWLTGNGYPTTRPTDITPLATTEALSSIRVNDLEAVTDVGAQVSYLRPGDIIAYEVPAFGDLRYEHQAVVIGWGCPYDHKNEENRCINADSVSNNYQSSYSAGLVPWIVDHGKTSYATQVPSRQRPYNHHRNYYDGNVDVIIHPIHIHDSFNIANVLIN